MLTKANYCFLSVWVYACFLLSMKISAPCCPGKANVCEFYSFCSFCCYLMMLFYYHNFCYLKMLNAVCPKRPRQLLLVVSLLVTP